ncbi:hypothetical protein ACT3UM_22520 [Halomonas sp. AOP13-D3-9]
MFLIIYPLRVMGFVAIAYCICVIGVYEFLNRYHSDQTAELFSIALRGGAVLNLLFLGFVYWGWRKLWALLPFLNSWLFPDLNGEWNMTIHHRKGGKNDQIQAKAFIKQSWLSMSMEVLSKDSDSQTLAIVPKKDPESGRAQIFYFYRVIPKKTGIKMSEPYEGSAYLRFFEAESIKLAGNYFTSVATDGHFELVRPFQNSSSG